MGPDFKTIADFRKDNGEAIRGVCREFVVLCPLQTPARVDAVQVAVDVDLQQSRRMVSRPPGRLRLHAIKAQLSPML